MATYKQIQDYVKSKHHRAMKNCWIAHAKEIHQLPRRNAYNRQSIEKRVYSCPDKELLWIEDAFRHYEMIK